VVKLLPDLNYDHVLAGLSAAVSAIAFLLPACSSSRRSPGLYNVNPGLRPAPDPDFCCWAAAIICGWRALQFSFCRPSAISTISATRLNPRQSSITQFQLPRARYCLLYRRLCRPQGSVAGRRRAAARAGRFSDHLSKLVLFGAILARCHVVIVESVRQQNCDRDVVAYPGADRADPAPAAPARNHALLLHRQFEIGWQYLPIRSTFTIIFFLNMIQPGSARYRS